MIRNESSAPYLLALLMTGGLSALIIGVELGVQGSSLAEPMQAAGGGIIVLGILALAHYIANLPGGEAEH